MATDDRTVIKTAHARAEGGVIPVAIDFGPDLGGEVEFKFMRAFGLPMADALGQIDEAKGMAQQLHAFRHFLETVVIPDQRDALIEHIDQGTLDLFTMKDLFEVLLEKMTGRPPTAPGLSSDGSGQSGAGSMDGALPSPSIPPPSPPTA